MLTSEHKSFLLESYCRNGVKLENVQVRFEEFRERFPFRETGSIDNNKSTGRSKKRIPEVVEKERNLMEATF
ncbi:hypothetical protein BDFB_012487 [Asbolus verrucosus]|uniref:Uncharacterized protein n=1 Tax=Asbolus verrucosus TaxID=1661398 RepID=A0A482VB73_ASBVE|nr:hypothetical protein BDFB_012487 [Asbolus verrucosus]